MKEKCVCGHDFERHREERLGGEGCFQGRSIPVSQFQWDWVICDFPSTPRTEFSRSRAS